MVSNLAAGKKVRTYSEYMETRLSPAERERINLEVSIMSKIIEARKQKGLSQQGLAELVGMQQPAIARLENMKTTPQIDTLIDILYPLGYTLEVVPLKDAGLTAVE